MTTDSTETRPFNVRGTIVHACSVYNYLGCPIAITSVAQQLLLYVKQKAPDARKFSSFLNKNHDAPFSIKIKVWRSALNSSLMYGCETWLTRNIQTADQYYKRTLKELLGVRATTCDEVIYVEVGVPDLKGLVQKRQQSFFRKLITRTDFQGSHLARFLGLIRDSGSPCGRYLAYIEQLADDPVNMSNEMIKQRIRRSDTTKRKTYMHINPALTTHQIYTDQVPEHTRIAVTRMRTSSHRLRIETGRWARVPPEMRLCVCGGGK